MTLVWTSDTVRSVSRWWLGAWFVVAALIVASGGAAGQSKGGKAMADALELEAEFTAAVANDGAAYRLARDKFLAHGAAALVFSKARQASGEWKVSLVADIMVGWLEQRALFELCTRAVTGQLPGPVPLTGRFSAQRRIAEVTRMGSSVTPLLLEMALKSKDIDAAEQTATVFGSMVALKDPRVVRPLVDAMLHSRDEPLREWAASTLGPLKDARAVQYLITVLRTAQASQMLRAAAAVSLGTLGAREALPDLRAVAADTSANLGYRKAAIGAIGDLVDAASAEGLLRTLGGTSDLPFQLYVLTVVGDIGSANVLPALKQIELNHVEEPVRELAAEARQKIADRISGK